MVVVMPWLHCELDLCVRVCVCVCMCVYAWSVNARVYVC